MPSFERTPFTPGSVDARANLQSVEGGRGAGALEQGAEKSLSERIAEKEFLIADYRQFTRLCEDAADIAKRLRLRAAEGVDLLLFDASLSPEEEKAVESMVTEMRKLQTLGFSEIPEDQLTANVRRLFQTGSQAFDGLRNDIMARHYHATLSLQALKSDRAARPTGDDLLRQFGA